MKQKQRIFLTSKITSVYQVSVVVMGWGLREGRRGGERMFQREKSTNMLEDISS